MIIVAMGVTGLLGDTVERFAYRPLRKAPRMNLLLSALGVSIFLQNLVLHFQGAKARFFPVTSLIPEGPARFPGGGCGHLLHEDSGHCRSVRAHGPFDGHGQENQSGKSDARHGPGY